jgi:acyl dehydratase
VTRQAPATLPHERLGSASRPDVRTIESAAAVAYALATNDPNPQYLSGQVAPPMFIVVPGIAAMGAATAELLSPDMIAHCVEARHDIHYTRPLIPKTELHTTASAHAIKNARSGDQLVMRIESRAASGDLVAEQFSTICVRGLSGSRAGGGDVPGHDFPATARRARLGAAASLVDPDQTYRYRDASGDDMPIHIDDEFARSVGLPGIIAHGFCTMAMCLRTVLGLAADGDATRLRRLAVRFHDFVRPGTTVDTTVFEGARPGWFHFEAGSDGRIVISDGLAVVDARPAPHLD